MAMQWGFATGDRYYCASNTLATSSGQSRRQTESVCCPLRKNAMFDVGGPPQHEHGHRLVEWIDDPVLGNPRFRVVQPLVLRVAARVVGADDLDHQVGARPEVVASAWIVRVEYQQQIRLPELSVANTQPQWGKEHRTAELHCTREQRQQQEPYDDLMLVRRHGQDIEMAVRELEQPPGTVRQLQVLRFGPRLLPRQLVD